MSDDADYWLAKAESFTPRKRQPERGGQAMATTQQTQAPKPPAPSRLALVTRGKVERPWRILVYGVEGVGKSSLIANSPEPVFAGESDGTAQMDVARLPEPATWQEL